MNYSPTEIKIKLIDKDNLIAMVTLKFGKMAIRGFRVMPSKVSKDFWVTPPCYKAGKWHPIFYLEDKEEWENICQMILLKLDEILAGEGNESIKSRIEEVVK